MQEKILIKIGTNCLINKNLKIQNDIIESIVKQIVKLKKLGYQIILVSSGGVGCGRIIKKIGVDVKLTLSQRSVLAGIGQVFLMNKYNYYLNKSKIHVAQILLLKQDVIDSIASDNLFHLLSDMISDNQILPIINENDTIAIPGLKFHDNDEMSKYLAILLNIKKVIFLTSVDGVYDGDMKTGKIIKSIKDEKDYPCKFFNNTRLGLGGMENKLLICKELSQNNIQSYIYNGNKKNCIIDIISGKNVGTTVYSKA